MHRAKFITIRWQIFDRGLKRRLGLSGLRRHARGLDAQLDNKPYDFCRRQNMYRVSLDQSGHGAAVRDQLI
jgi:hypothetical protein